MREFKKGDPVICNGKKYTYDSKSNFDGLVVVQNSGGEFFHFGNLDITHDNNGYLNFKDGKIVFASGTDDEKPNTNAILSNDEQVFLEGINEMDRKAFANAVLSKAKRGANHWAKNLGL